MGLSDISPECQATLDSWCNERSHCPHVATHGRLHARFDRATMSPASAWRCYAEDTLSPDLRSYSHGHAYCTRQLGLQEIYTECREVSEPTHVQVSSTGASVVLPVPASPPSPSPSPSPLPSPPSSPSTPPELDLTQWAALEPWTHEGMLTISKGRRRAEPAPLRAIGHDVRTFHPGQVCSRCPRCSCQRAGRPRRSCSRCMRGGLAVWRTTRRTGRSSRSTRGTCPGGRPSSSATASRSQLKPDPEPEPEPEREPERETRIPSLT